MKEDRKYYWEKYFGEGSLCHVIALLDIVIGPPQKTPFNFSMETFKFGELPQICVFKIPKKNASWNSTMTHGLAKHHSCAKWLICRLNCDSSVLGRPSVAYLSHIFDR